MVLHGIVLLASARAVSRKTPTYFIERYKMHDLGGNEAGLKLLMDHPRTARSGWKTKTLQYAVSKGEVGCASLLLNRIDPKYIPELVKIAR